jgi:uncharacterized protein YigA (DUF484 family)
MSLVKTIGELSDYANSVGGLLRLKRREEKWVSIVEWIALNQQVKELTEKLVEALSDADKRIGIHKQEAQKLEVELEQANAHVESLQGIVKWRAEELEQAKQEVKLWKKNRNIYVEKKNKLTEQIANAKQILEEYGCGDCTPAVLLREVLK